MASSNPQVRSELNTLRKDMNDYLSTELHYILQESYRHKNKARKLIETLIKLVGPVEMIFHDPEFVHDTLLDDGLAEQKLLIAQLEKDFPADDDHKAFLEAESHLKAVYAVIKQLRHDVPTHH